MPEVQRNVAEVQPSNTSTPPVLLLGEARGENEAKINSSFVGASGVELLKMLSEAGIIEWTDADQEYLRRYYNENNPLHLEMVWQLHPEVARTNVFNRRPAGNRIEDFCGPKATAIRGYPALVKSKYVRQEFIPELERLADEITTWDPYLIICLGNTPLWALAGSTGISKLRGTTRLSTHTATGYKLLPTFHPAAVLRQWELRPTVIADLMKAKRESEYPEIRRTPREIWIEPNAQEVLRFIDTYVLQCELLSVDIETSGTLVTCIGLSPKPDLALVVPFFDSRKPGRSYWPDRGTEAFVWHHLKRVLEDKAIKKVLQNGAYDIAFLWRSVGVRVFGAEEDTMLCHHALQPESLKSLGFLGSIYCDEGAWKSERKTATIKRDE